MHSHHKILLAINLIGGLAVLGSYAHGLISSGLGNAFWGDVPESLKPMYTVSMVTATLGYFAFSAYLFKLAPDEARFFGRYSFNLVHSLFVVILVASALWMPLTFAMLASPSDGLWWAIRLTLAAVGIGSLGLLVGLLAVRPSPPSLAHKLAVLGSLAFCFQTAILDALVWPAYFPASV